MKTPLFRLLLLALSVLAATQTFVQDKKTPPNPPATATGKAGNATITVVYSSPSAKGRPIWG